MNEFEPEAKSDDFNTIMETFGEGVKIPVKHEMLETMNLDKICTLYKDLPKQILDSCISHTNTVHEDGERKDEYFESSSTESVLNDSSTMSTNNNKNNMFQQNSSGSNPQENIMSVDEILGMQSRLSQLVSNEKKLFIEIRNIRKENLELKDDCEKAKQQLASNNNAKNNSQSNLREIEILRSSITRLRNTKKDLKTQLLKVKEEFDLLKGMNESIEERNKMLEQKMLEQNNIDNDNEVLHSTVKEYKIELDEKMKELITSNLQCSICQEVFMFSTTINCGHTFCNLCITTWKKEKHNCPLCRSMINIQIQNTNLDNYITKFVDTIASSTFKDERKMLIMERKSKIENEIFLMENTIIPQLSAPPSNDYYEMQDNNQNDDTESSEELEEFLQSVRAIGLSRAIGVLTNIEGQYPEYIEDIDDDPVVYNESQTMDGAARLENVHQDWNFPFPTITRDSPILHSSSPTMHAEEHGQRRVSGEDMQESRGHLGTNDNELGFVVTFGEFMVS